MAVNGGFFVFMRIKNFPNYLTLYINSRPRIGGDAATAAAVEDLARFQTLST